MEIKDRLKLLREEKKWSKTETAKRLKISSSSYSNYEYGNRKPSSNMLIKIANLFGVSLPYLLEGKYMLSDIHMMSDEEKENYFKDISNEEKQFSEQLNETIKQNIINVNVDSLNFIDKQYWYNLTRFYKIYSQIDDHTFIKNISVILSRFNQIYDYCNDPDLSIDEKNKHLDLEFDDLSSYGTESLKKMETYFRNKINE